MRASIPGMLHERLEATPHTVAYEVRTGEGWRTWTWREVGEVVRELAGGLRDLGVGPGDRVVVLANTCLEWMLADFAVLSVGAATTTVYPSSTTEECRFIMTDSGATLAFVEDGEQAAKLGDVRSIQMIGPSEGFTALRARGRRWLAAHPRGWEAGIRSVGAEDLATLIYTSGTTGRPKGVRLVHDNWLAQSDAIAPVVEGLREPGDKLFVWLPLAHAYGKVLQLAGVAYGVPTVIDGDLTRLARSLQETRPTWVPAVPRVFEKLRERAEAGARAKGPRAHQVFLWAEQVAIAESRCRRAGRRVPLKLRAQHALADRLVLRRVREAVGGRVRAFLSGSAPLSEDLHHFLDGAGLVVLEGWGLTECAAVATANRPDDLRLGSVGKPGDTMQVRIAEDGEVLIRGRAVMRGYHGLPDATAQAFRDGWFRTGDLGRIDGAGFLHITGRIKELIITAGGKNIAPVPIEAAIKARSAVIGEVVLVGDRRPCLGALVALDPERAPAWARERGLPEDLPSLAARPEVRAEIAAAVDGVNATLASYQTVKGFEVLDRAFSVAGGEITPSQKLRRAEVIARDGHRLDALWVRS